MNIVNPVSKYFNFNKVSRVIISFFLIVNILLVFPVKVEAAPTISNLDSNSFQAKLPAEIVDDDISFSSGIDYRGGYLEYKIDNPTQYDNFGMIEDSSPSNTDGEISVVNGIVYKGTGSGSAVIGNIDSNINGSNGILRINFSNEFENGDFSAPLTADDNIVGWTKDLHRISFDRGDYIAGFPTPTDNTYPSNNGDIGDDVYGGTFSRNISIINGQVKLSTGSDSLNYGYGYGIIRGPAIYSNSTVQLQEDDQVSFYWETVSGGDAYDAYGYLLNVNPGSTEVNTIKILDETGSESNSSANSTAEVTIGSGEEGEYRFVFVAGSYDATGGLYVGGSLIIDNVVVTQSNPLTVDDIDLSTIAKKITYKNSSDVPVNQKNVTVTAENSNKVTFSDSTGITIADPPYKTLGSNTAVIGEKITNTIKIPLKSSTTGDLVIIENLATGMELSSFQISAENNNISYTIDVGPSSGDSGTLIWDLSGVQNNSTDNSVNNLVVEYEAVIKDLTANQSGNKYSSSAIVNYNNVGFLPTNSTTVTLKEPEIKISKNLNTTGPVEAGDEVSYTIEIAHTENSTADAYDIALTDILEKTSYTGYEVGTYDPGSPTESADANGDTKLEWNNIDLPLNSTYSFTVKGTIDSDIMPEENLSSKTNLEWTSIDGENAEERIYSREDSFVVEDSNLIKDITKINNLNNIDDSPQYVIGEKLNYTLEFEVIKGTTENLELKASLPAGVKYLSSSIVPDGTGDNDFSISKPTANSTGDLSWNFGTISNASESNTIKVDFELQIVNSAVNEAGQNKTISTQLEYDTAAGIDKTTNQKDISFTLKEPEIKIAKSYTEGNYDAGDTLTYKLELYHPATSSPNDVSAYDLMITDELPEGMTFVKFDANNSALTENYDSDTKTLSWEIDKLNTNFDKDNNYTLSYQVKLNEDVEPTQNLSKSASVTWTSLAADDDSEERDGSEDPSYNDYKSESSSSLSLKDDTAVTLRTKDGNSEYAVGEEITYQLKLDLNEGITKNLKLKNSLAAGMQYIDHQIIKGNDRIVIDYSDLFTHPNPGSNDDPLLWSFDKITNPSDNDITNDYLIIEYTAYIEDVDSNSNGDQLITTGDLSYEDAGGNEKLSSDSFTTTVLASDADESWSFDSIARPKLEMTLSDRYEEGTTLSAGEKIRYTIEINNSGEAALRAAELTAAVPSNTNYVVDSTYVNGQKISDDNGEFPLNNSYEISSPAGSIGEITLNDKTTIEYTVEVVETAAIGTEIQNQAKLEGVGEIIGAKIQSVFSDDPASLVKNDKTRSLVGDAPLITISKEITDENAGTDNSGDRIKVTDTIENTGNETAKSIESKLTTSNSYQIDKNSIQIKLNGVQLEDEISVTIEDDQLIVNLGDLEVDNRLDVSYELVKKDEATEVVIVESITTVSSANTPESEISKSLVVGNNSTPLIKTSIDMTDLNGTAVETGDTIEYLINIENVGTAAANNLNITNNLPTELNYNSGTALINSSVLADQAGELALENGFNYGELKAGKTIEIRYKTKVADTAENSSILNTVQAAADNSAQVTASVSVETSAVPGSVTIRGTAKSEKNIDPEDWIVQLWSNDNKLKEKILDSSGYFEFKGLSAFRDYTVYLKHPENNVVFSKSEISFSGDNAGSIENEDSLLLDPEGIVYDSILRKAVQGAKISLVDADGELVPDSYLADPSQQGQITPADGSYKLEIDFANAPDAEYRIKVEPPAGYIPDMPSKVVLPASDTAVSPNEIDDKDAADGVQVSLSDEIPEGKDTTYYLAFNLAQGDPGIFNNHIPVDPADDSLMTVTKTAAKKTASVGEFVKYMINIKNNTQYSISSYDLYDKIPVGFKYVENSSVIKHQNQDIYSKEPIGSSLLKWEGLDIEPGEEFSLSYSLLIGSGAENNQDYINRAYIMISNSALSNTAEASIMVELDPVFSYTTIIGKVFTDNNGNGIQDKGEKGIAGVELITNEGQLITTDKYGRYSISINPNSKSKLGETLVIKLVKSSLEEGFSVKSTNPVIIKTSSAVMKKVNFIVE